MIEVRIDEEVITAALSAAATNAVRDGLGSWQAAHDMRQIVERAVSDLELPRRLGERLAAVMAEQAEALVETVAQACLPAIRQGMAEAVQTQMVALVVALRHSETGYLSAEARRALIDKVRQELFPGGAA